MTQSQESSLLYRIPIAGFLAWLLPGLGHIYVGERKRGIVILATIGALFWTGVAIGGVRETVDANRKRLWFMAQIASGSHAIGAYGFGEISRRGLTNAQLVSSRWNSVEVAMVYTGVAGLLNLLAILDALVRVDPARRRESPVIGTTGARAESS